MHSSQDGISVLQETEKGQSTEVVWISDLYCCLSFAIAEA